MGALLYIPWFKAEPWEVPLPFSIPLLGDTLPIQPFGVLVAIGVLLGARMAEWFAKRNGVAPGAVADLITHVVLLGFVLGYILNGVFYHPETVVEILRQPSLLFTRWLGLSSYGGFLGAIAGVWLWGRRRKVPVLPVADAVAFGFPFGWLFGRTGCFVVHDHPGRVTDFFLAVNDYRVGMPPYEPRHDLGLYEVFWSLGCIALFVVLRRRPRPQGLFVALLPVLYAPIRFFLDFLRAPPESGGDVRYFGLTPGQYASVAVFVLGLVLLRHIVRRPQAELPEVLRWPPPDETQGEEATPPGADAGTGGSANAPGPRS
ncbi:MAG: prolipoprotein diacylglyceryl transferase [Myxococcota bacterium]